MAENIEMSELEQKILRGMAPYVEYVMSEIGYIAFGRYRLDCQDSKHLYPRSPQGSALAVGKHVRGLRKKGMILMSKHGYQKSRSAERLVPFVPKDKEAGQGANLHPK